MDKESVIKYVRGLINSSTIPLTIRNLDRDYKTLEGERIPFAKLGFKSVEEFLRSAPTLNLIKNGEGEIIVQAQRLAESAHIVDMVKKQKPPKKLKRSRFVKSAPPKNWRSYNSQRYDKSQFTSPRVARVAHNQFVDYKQPKVASKVVVPDHSAFSHNRNLPPRLLKQTSQNSRLQVTYEHEEVFTKSNTAFVANTLREVRKASLDEEYNNSGSSRRKMITKKMSEINLDRDSGNSSPISDTTPPISDIITPPISDIITPPISDIIPPPVNVPQFVLTNNPKVDLTNFVEFYKLGKIEVSTKCVSTKRLNMYTCKITIGNYNVNSYPQEFPTREAAELYCYKQALEELTAKYGKSESLFLANDNDILKRIPDMLKKHNSGIWGWQLQLDYSQRYNEQLPQDWMKIVDRSPFIHVQKIVNDYTLKYCRPEDVFQKGIVSMKSMTISDVSVPANTVRLDDNHKTYAEITYIPSANEIWCRQVGTEETEAHSQMISSMEEYYENNLENLHAVNINPKGYYVANFNNNWFRVRAIDVNETSVKCFYIDFGDEVTLPKEQIYQLKREFAFCEAQAFVCRLAGLEDIYEVSQDSKALQEFLYRAVEMELAEETIESENEILPVYMYDMETGSCINFDMMMLLDQEFATPRIGDNITEVCVSHIADNGDIYIQVRGHGHQRLLQLLADLEYQIVNDPPTHTLQRVTKENSQEKIYLGKYNVDGHWYRVKILDWSPNQDFIQIYYVDFGNTEVVKVKEAVLYPLDKLNDVINKYPHQAVRTRILLDSPPNDLKSLLTTAIPMNEPIIAKVMGHTQDENKLPLVEFFSRTSKGGLFCINKSINMTNEIKKVDNTSKSNKKVHFSAENSKHVPSGGQLECPPLPEKNTYFEIHVPFAVNPYNFFVQPLESLSKLNRMMEQLQDKYKHVTYSPLTLDQIQPGNIYASRFDDGNWYRTTVIKVIHDGSISVFYCDFGYYSNLTLQQLIPLDVEFLTLPYQALKAKMSGIKPKDTNWTVKHCDKFKEMVERKHLYSFVVNIEKDQLYDSDLVLDLLLIDTSSEEDLRIDEYLISQGIAVKASPKST
ncbi:tudor domain-containing protein 7-like isoform X1 [Diabrotica undecimpunctata]|uniref:tudor domain-containing protein 7-like isoform X1 n=1 Tax=Diabrotica undecimpunctata TaxID=50387 RepID=UPI003B631CB8